MLPIRIFKVRDASMEPALREGDYLVVSRWYGRLKVGDMVVLRHPRKDILMVKRVSAIGSNSIHVIGDNREESEDSRAFGNVKRESIIGRVILRV